MSPSASGKAILIDIGGVLVPSILPAAAGDWGGRLAMPPAAFLGALFGGSEPPEPPDLGGCSPQLRTMIESCLSKQAGGRPALDQILQFCLDRVAVHAGSMRPSAAAASPAAHRPASGAPLPPRADRRSARAAAQASQVQAARGAGRGWTVKVPATQSGSAGGRCHC